MGVRGEDLSRIDVHNEIPFSLSAVSLYLKLTASIAIVAVGCAPSQVRISSTPEKAEVFLAVGGQQPTRIGETPLVIARESLPQASQPIRISIRKKGFDTENVLIPQASFSGSIEISSQLVASQSDNQCVESRGFVDKLSKSILLIQSMVNKGEYRSAEQAATALLTEYPDAAMVNVLVGNVHYLNRRFDEALRAYEKALRIDPSNREVEDVISRLRGGSLSRGPANAERDR